MRLKLQYILPAVLCSAWLWAASGPSETITIGSKKFTENVILGEIIYQAARSLGIQAAYRRELGGTRILWNALRKGDIDIYPEYTGTIRREILAGQNSGDSLPAVLARLDVIISDPLGFNNTYAIGMKREQAAQLNIRKISDLKNHPDLYYGFTNEFMDRSDGWPGLQQRYNLPRDHVSGLDHDLAYRGLAEDAVQVIDMYSTDAEIAYYDLIALDDELNYFPRYEAVFLYRLDLNQRAGALVRFLERLAGQISAQDMIRMNARARLERIPESGIAAEFLKSRFNMEAPQEVHGFWYRLRRNTAGHLNLVFVSLTAAILLAIPLGVAAARISGLDKLILGITGVIQTIPSLALLVFMIPLLGIGGPPAILALFLYSLLPIVRNTYTGLHDIAPPLQESARALGLPATARLIKIELPLASRSILAGIKTSAVINVGTATLGALIGAGGYGQPILTGIRLDDMGLILEGAVPAALLALLVQWLFDLSERVFVPRGLRIEEL